MSRKRTLEEKRHSKLVTKLASLKWRETVLEENLKLNRACTRRVTDEIDALGDPYRRQRRWPHQEREGYG